MNKSETMCQSCGMPLDKDPVHGGSNADKSLSQKYCSFCYREGKFLDEGITLEQKISKNVQIAVKMGMPEDKARQLAETTIPNLERWRNNNSL